MPKALGAAWQKAAAKILKNLEIKEQLTREALFAVLCRFNEISFHKILGFCWKFRWI